MGIEDDDLLSHCAKHAVVVNNVNIEGTSAKIFFKSKKDTEEGFKKLNYTHLNGGLINAAWEWDMNLIRKDSNLFISNLPKNAPPKDVFNQLYKALSSYGVILSIHLYLNPSKTATSGPGCVQFENHKDAANVLKQMILLNGEFLKIDIYWQKKR